MQQQCTCTEGANSLSEICEVCRHGYDQWLDDQEDECRREAQSTDIAAILADLFNATDELERGVKTLRAAVAGLIQEVAA